MIPSVCIKAGSHCKLYSCVASPFKLKMINSLLQHRNAMFILTDFIDCLQSAFSLKNRLVLISASAIANHDVMLQ